MRTFQATTIAAVPLPSTDDATERQIIAALDAGEDYSEGTPLEAAILAFCRATGRYIVWTDSNGNVTCFGDVEGRAQ